MNRFLKLWSFWRRFYFGKKLNKVLMHRIYGCGSGCRDQAQKYFVSPFLKSLNSVKLKFLRNLLINFFSYMGQILIFCYMGRIQGSNILHILALVSTIDGNVEFVCSLLVQLSAYLHSVNSFMCPTKLLIIVIIL